MTVAKVCIALAFVAITYASSMTNEDSLEESIAKYIQNQEVSVELPYVGSTVTLDAKNLDEDEINVKVKMSHNDQARKSKLKKIFAPLLVIVILKAITLIPLALGILGLKTWNAIQLSFVTFVISIALAVFELCKKVATDHTHPVITHSPWNAARSFFDENSEAQDMAYSAHLL